MNWIQRELRSLWQNVRAGGRMLLFRREALGRLHISADQVFWLVVLDVLLSLTVAWLGALPRPDFNLWGLSSLGLSFAALFGIGYLIARLFRNGSLVLRFVVCVYSVAPWFTLFGLGAKKGYVFLAAYPWAIGALWWTYILWYFTVVGWILLQLAGQRSWRVAATFAGFVAFTLSTLSLHVEFFYPGEPDPGHSKFSLPNAENTFDAQHDLLQAAAQRLKPGHPGVPELFFLGFAGFGSQDVFKKEVLYARDLLDRRFGTRGHSLVMINHPDTATSLPLASGSNLRRLLKVYARRMNRQEDILFVYLTSHGSEKQGLAAQLWPLSLNALPADRLKTYLDEAGIRWRVLLISACYSGNFVDVLRNEETLVMTASAADKQSFGCSNARDFTYFGEAVFRDALQHQRQFIPAFQEVIAAIQKREKDERLTPSDPQLFIGSRIAAKLANLQNGASRVSAVRP